jgi:meso-butanediol dehydrogenase/(S,S)-butanediol dehydrogenase/diacetyl reductase
MKALMKSGRLEGKTALITGGGAGIGAATGLLFCQEGAAVVLVDRDEAALAETVQMIQSQVPGARVTSLAADVADDAAAARAVAYCTGVFGGLDVLVNNAAMRNYAAIADAQPQEWRSVMDVNLLGAASFCKAALPALRQSGKGSIVTVSSCYAVTGRKGMAIYDASKAALLALTRSLAFEEAAHGVRANAICPGSTLTAFQIDKGKTVGKDIEALMQDRKDNSLIGRWGTPQEIAWPILWLAGDEASFITGTTLMVDGGLSVM